MRGKQHTVAAAAVLALVGLALWQGLESARVAAAPPPEVAASGIPQPLPTSAVMHAKLHSAQLVLAGLVSEDYEQVARAASDLQSLADNVPSRLQTAGDDRAYQHFRAELGRLAGELTVMAEERNLNGAAYVQQQMTATCIGCHQHLRDRQPTIQLMDHEVEPDAPEIIR